MVGGGGSWSPAGTVTKIVNSGRRTGGRARERWLGLLARHNAKCMPVISLFDDL